MYLLWLRVATILYAAAGITIFPAVLYGIIRWRKTCVHLGGLAFFFHFVSVVEMMVQAHRWMPVSVREIESLLGLAVAALFFLVWWLYDAISLGIFALPATFFLVFIPALGPDRYTFPSEGVRVSWLVAHIVALLVAYAALEAVEMVGLWFAKRWAEYLTFVATVVFIPLEVYELSERITVFRVLTFLINVAIVAYLLLAKRLFGLRGGHAKVKELRKEQSGWVAVDRATPPSGVPG